MSQASDIKPIGGYFTLEINPFNNMPNAFGVLLNTGRNALEYVLRSLGNCTKLYIPYFTCDSVIEPLTKLNISHEFYSINERLEIQSPISLNKGEYLVYTNYYGIKDEYIKKLASIYPTQLIVDNAQALFCPPTNKCIYSPRKFVGLPDGGIAFTDTSFAFEELTADISHDRCHHLLKRIDLGVEAGYADFRANSVKLKNQPIMQMSNLTRTLITSIDFEGVKDTRKKNFQLLHEALSSSNKLEIPEIKSFACPLVYPYLTDNRQLKQHLIENKIFVATYWPNVLAWCNENTIEYELADKVIAIPIDQRYGEKEMNIIIKLIKG